jgi:predicted permease
MTIASDALYRLRALFRRRRIEEELSLELEHHLATQIAFYERHGIAHDEAVRRARVDLRSIEYVKDQVRDVRGLSTLEIGMQDLRYAIRSLLRAPAFTLAAVLTLGLGIGSATAVFSMLEGVVLRPLPYEDPDRLVTLWDVNRETSLDHELLSPVNFVDYRTLRSTFRDMAGWWRTEFVLTDENTSEPVRLDGVEVTTNFLDVLGVTPHIGQGFTGDSALRSGFPAVMIGHRLWLTRYAGDPEVVGKTLRLNGNAQTIVGIMPAGFEFPGQTEIWVGLGWDLTQHSRGAHFYEAVARLAPGVTVDRANRDLGNLTARLAADFPPTNDGWTTRAIPLDEEVAGSFRPALFALLGASSLLLLIACINVANLLLARGATRRREVALRSAIGASRARVLRLFLTEGAAIAAAGTALGLVLAIVGTRAIIAWSPVEIPRAGEIGINAWVLAFSIAVAMVTAIAFGLAPARDAVKSELAGTLRDGAAGAGTRSRKRSGALVVAEVALAVMLLAGAGLVMRSVSGLLAQDLNIDPTGVVTAQVQLPRASYRGWQDVNGFYERLGNALRARPEITEAGLGYYLPLDAAYRIPYTVVGNPPPSPDDLPTAQFHSVDEGYFAVLETPMIGGRSFARTDDASAIPVVIVNEALARQQFGTEDPIGRRLRITVTNIGPLGARIVDGNEHEIIGVVADVKNTSLRDAAEPAVYFASRQFPYLTMHVVMRGRVEPAQLVPLLREEVRRLDPGLAMGEARTMESVLAGTIDAPRLVRMLLGVFAALALTLAAVGIYGILTFAVANRRREMSVRIALGAEPGAVLRMVVWEGLLLALIGFVLGIIGARLAGGVLASFLYGIGSWDPMTMSSVLVVLLVVAGAACLAPAMRAAAEDPARALRAE